jgi:hypothetical protein
MRITLVLLLSALFALPLTAQTTRKYQPPQAGEMEKLRDDSTPELREVRGGEIPRKASLTAGERAQLEALKKAFPAEWEAISQLRAGRVRIHAGWWDSWGIYVVIPGISTTVAVLILILLFLLIL